MKYAIEDTEFAPGHVVVPDGCPHRMMITSTVAGFATCIRFCHGDPRYNIFHESVLTLDGDQKWLR